MSKDTNRLLGHADEADGIEEYDNPLPDWWLGLFWFCIIWAIGYTVHYHFIADRSQEGHYAAEVAAAEARWPTDAASDAAFALTPGAISAGSEVFSTYCVACHGQNLEGFIGPSFLDDEWIHGHTPEEVIHTITNGVLDKGMTPWGGILTPQQINHVAAFVLSKNAEALGKTLEEMEASWAAGGEGGDDAAVNSEGGGDDSGGGEGDQGGSRG